MTVNTTLVKQLNDLCDELNNLFPERKDAIEVLALSVLAKEHSFLLGPPGTAKSLLIRTFVRAITGASYFECAMSKTRSTEAILGPLDIQEFRTNGNQWRKHAGFLTDSNFVFIDEIGKMSPILGHDMLAALNERIRHEVRNGRSEHPIPLYSAFTASNEVITDDNDDAAALWDRLLFRVTVDYLQDKKNFAALLQAGPMVVNTKIDWKDLQDAIDNDVPNVQIDPDAMKGLLLLRAGLRKDHIHPSDRRWKSSLKALQAKAYMEGRDTIYEEDLAVLRFTLWDTVQQIEKIERLAIGAANPFVDRVMTAKSQLKELSDGLAQRKDKAVPEKATYAKEMNKKMVEVRADLDKLLGEAKGRAIPKFKEVSDLHRDLLIRMYVECFEQDEEMATAAANTKTGLGDGGQTA